ncbi:hypothetical protein GOBAR_AA36463 [Gossypium barbadense]|uniref:ATP synthase subunit e, mitochondrial n=1 Tax=Gossypium barbadense TaxID=3634 RepID=A0A2P5VZH8_GOSBA|nr:hypothetical protein GOBAR_AA36463 [Gossypium barbadense]
MAPPPGPYSGTSTLALVARASAFSFGLVYGNFKLKYLKDVSAHQMPCINGIGEECSCYAIDIHGLTLEEYISRFKKLVREVKAVKYAC